MPLTTTDYPKLTQKLNEVFNESASSAMEEWIGRQIFDVIDTDWKIYDYLSLHGVGGFAGVDEAFHLVDQSMADVLTNGFSGTTYTDVFGDTVANTAVDGVVLFSASHTNNLNSTTYRNLIRNAAGTANPALDRDPIVKARSDARTFKDPNGINRPTMLDTLIVSAANEDLAERLVYSQGVAGTPNVDINPIKGKIKNIIVWSKLDTR